METMITPDRQYKISFNIQPRVYSVGQYDKFLITMNITDITGIPKILISCNELEFTRFLNDLNIYLDEYYGWCNVGNAYSFDYTFSPNGNGDQINIQYGHDFPHNLIGCRESESPEEDYYEEYLTFYINKISLYNMYVSNILHFKANLDQATDILMCGWNTIENVPYVEDLMYSDLLEMMRHD